MALNLSIFDTEDKINHGIPIVLIVHKGDNRYANLLLAPDTKQIFAQLILDNDDALYAEMNADGTPYMSGSYKNYVRWQRGKDVVTGWKFMTPEEMKALNWDHYKYSDRPLWQPTIHSHQMFQ